MAGLVAEQVTRVFWDQPPVGAGFLMGEGPSPQVRPGAHDAFRGCREWWRLGTGAPPPRGHRLGRTQFPRSMGGVHFDVNITNLVTSEPDTAGLRANLGLPVPDGRFGPLLSDKAATQQL